MKDLKNLKFESHLYFSTDTTVYNSSPMIKEIGDQGKILSSHIINLNHIYKAIWGLI